MRAGSRREGTLSQAGVNRRCEPLTVLIHSRTGRLAQCISSCVQTMVPWRRRAHHSKRAGGRGAGGPCRRHRDPVPPFSDPALAAPAGSVGISAAVVVATWRAAMLDDPRIDQLAPDRFRRRRRAFCVCAHQPRIAGDISGQERRQPPLDPLSAQCSLPPPLTLGSRRWHKLNSAPRAETDQRRSRQARAARRPQLPHALRRAEWPLLGRRQSTAGQAMNVGSGSTADRRGRVGAGGLEHQPSNDRRSKIED